MPAVTRTPNRRERSSQRKPSQWLIATAVIASWITILGWRLATVIDEWWRWRDDGVITLSHSLNWVEFGTIGVSPGDRSEAFSSPLHFAVGAALLILGDPGYAAITLMIFGLSMVLAAGATASTLLTVANRYPLKSQTRSMAVWLLGTAVALLFITSWTSVGWQASGMENPLFVACAFVVVAAAAGRTSTPLATTTLVTALTALGLVRVEFVLLVPLVVVAATATAIHRTEPKWRGVVFAVVLLVPPAVWAVVHGIRWWYFGGLYPTSALTQGKSVDAESISWIIGIGLVWLIVAGCAALALPRWLRVGVWTVTSTGLSITAVVVGTSHQEDGDGVITIVTLLAATASWLVTAAVLQGERAYIDGLFMAIALIPVAQTVALGPARIDDYRVFGLAVPVLALWVAVGVLRAVGRSRGLVIGAVRVPLRARTVATAAVTAAAVNMVAIPVVSASADSPRPLGWEIRSEFMLDGVGSFVNSKLPEGARPIGANPDLGKVSYAKSAQLVDLGLLGEPLLARIFTERPELLPTYLGKVVRPDVVQSHGTWSCRYRTWIDTDDFQTSYAVVDSLPTVAGPTHPGCPMDGRLTVWHQRVNDELALTGEILSSATPSDVVASALADCKVGDDDPFRCESVMRAVWRSHDELARRGELPGVMFAMNASPSRDLDLLLLERPAGWADRAFEVFSDMADRSE